jgi:hypothetical protein
VATVGPPQSVDPGAPTHPIIVIVALPSWVPDLLPCVLQLLVDVAADLEPGECVPYQLVGHCVLNSRLRCCCAVCDIVRLCT